jgi:hypothetical protein
MRHQTIVFCFTLLLAGFVGCESDHSGEPTASHKPAVETDEPAGARLWAENCSRCHNLRPPQSFSAAQWDVVVHHMRQRANLTGDEARWIAEFLQAAN